MNRYHRRAFVYSCFLIFLLLSQLAVPTLVVCFGSNGHLAVEMKHAPAASTGPQDHGGPCVDAPVLVARSDDRAVNLLSGFMRFAHFPLRLAFAASAVPLTPVLHLPFASFYTWIPQPLSASLRSVLLLI